MESKKNIQTKRKCKLCDFLISENLMLTHFRYAHPSEKVNSKNINSFFKDTDHSQHRLNSLNTKFNLHEKSKSSLLTSNKNNGYLNSDGTVECVLCRQLIKYSDLEKHMQNIHKVSIERYRNYLKTPKSQKNRWVTFCQGGLPSLGKKY